MPGPRPAEPHAGEGELVYIAGHRTTYLPPFGRIDDLRRGDPISIEAPYGEFRYVVTSHRIVEETISRFSDRPAGRSCGFRRVIQGSSRPAATASPRSPWRRTPSSAAG